MKKYKSLIPILQTHLSYSIIIPIGTIFEDLYNNSFISKSGHTVSKGAIEANKDMFEEIKELKFVPTAEFMFRKTENPNVKELMQKFTSLTENITEWRKIPTED
jgi:hypothetical protein